MWVLLLTGTIFSFTQNMECRQAFESRPSYTEVNPGDDAVMLCRVFEKNRHSACIWQKDGKPIRMQPGKYEWDGIKESGDCSLRLISADIDYDDGLWECQVSPSSFDANDALSSNPARLIVRVPPSDPRIYYDDQYLISDPTIQIPAGQPVKVRCESRNGNPPPILKWYINDEEVSGSIQINETGNSRLFNAISNVEILASKDDNEKILKCVALHEAYPRNIREIKMTMNVMYPPIVSLKKTKEVSELEALIDSVSFHCLTDANPSADIFWRKAGGDTRYPSTEYLTFEPVRQGDEGTYFCMAQNEIGSSDELSISFDVLYPPRNMEMAPSSKTVDVRTGSITSFRCSADGNPSPEIEWIQRINTIENGEKLFSRGSGHTFNINNVSYGDQGEWTCSAFNDIKGKERRIRGSFFNVDVSGKPSITFPENALSFVGGENVIIKGTFCSDPRHEEVRWEWGSLELIEGQTHGRFYFSPIKKRLQDCYEAEIRIKEATREDSRIYYLTVKNEEGKVNRRVSVSISDPISLTAILAAGSSGIVILILISCVIIYFVKKKSSKGTCLSEREPESIKPEVFSQGASTDNLQDYVERVLPPESSLSTTVPRHSYPSSFPKTQATNKPLAQKTPPNVQYADIHFRKKYSYSSNKHFNNNNSGHYCNFNGFSDPHTTTFKSGIQADV